MMGKWFENYETFEPAFNLYFALRTQPSQFLDTKILWLTQALETLHRRSSDETEMSEEEFASLRRISIAELSKKQTTVVESQAILCQ